MLSLGQLFATLWTIAHQAPLSMGFSRQEYGSGLPFPPLGDLLYPGIETESPMSPALQADSLPLSYQGSPISHMWNLKKYNKLMNIAKKIRVLGDFQVCN